MHGNMNLWAIMWESGLVVKAVLLILIAASIFSWTIVLQKKKSFEAVDDANKNFLMFFGSNNNLVDIFERTNQLPESSIGFVYKKGFDEYKKIAEKIGVQDKNKIKEYLSLGGAEAIERSLKQGISISNEKLEDKLSILASISSVTPFVGLLGTVWGIIDSFTGLSQGGGSIEAVAPGIAEALVATAVGLFAAIPANWFYNMYSTKLQKINTEMENFAQDFINLIERSHL
jgi:biopolymer transport protein TolQ